MSDVFVDYFQLLEVHMLASSDAIKASYKRLAAKHHPDNGGSEQIFHQIQQAYDTLTHQKDRKEYLNAWKKTYLSYNQLLDKSFIMSDYDMAFNAARETLGEYMFFIQNHRYDLAYDLLSRVNKKHLFKREFTKWQQCVGEIHHLLEMDYMIDTFNEHQHLQKFVEHDFKVITFRVKVKEYNCILNRTETEYFSRDMVYEDHQWRIFLPNIDVKAITKKYKQIINVYRKKWTVKEHRFKQNDHFYTKFMSQEGFLNNMEYERLRHVRYDHVFSVVRLNINEGFKMYHHLIEKILEKETRQMDSFTNWNKSDYLVLLPETTDGGARVVVDKLKHRFEDVEGLNFSLKYISIQYDIKSVKDLIRQLIKKDEIV
jgi:curved DNA-binding protein CbpA